MTNEIIAKQRDAGKMSAAAILALLSFEAPKGVLVFVPAEIYKTQKGTIRLRFPSYKHEWRRAVVLTLARGCGGLVTGAGEKQECQCALGIRFKTPR